MPQFQPGNDPEPAFEHLPEHLPNEWDGWVYSAVVLDLFSRKAVGWAVGRSPDAELVGLVFLDIGRPNRNGYEAGMRCDGKRN